MRHHIKIVALNNKLNYNDFYIFCLETYRLIGNKKFGLNISDTILEDGKIFIDVSTSGTNDLVNSFLDDLKNNTIKYLPKFTKKLESTSNSIYNLTFTFDSEINSWKCQYINEYKRRNKRINFKTFFW